MKVFNNTMQQQTEGFALFRYRGHTIHFNDSESKEPMVWYCVPDTMTPVNFTTVQEAIEAINKLELKLAEA